MVGHLIFRHFLSFMLNSARPEFTGTLAIKGGRHPILETVQSAGTTVPNDVYCCDSSAFQIIQGPKRVNLLVSSLVSL